ncbi:MAG TPA: hypothetical protein VIL97_03815 [Thermoanaerobaculia bacterium]
MNRRHFLVIFLLVALIAIPAAADHSWENYHWARTSNPFTLKVHDNVGGTWDAYLQEAAADWSASPVLDLDATYPPLSNVKRCASASGRIEACNSKYGNTGWLGIAGISISGSHITKAYTKVNDTYFNTATYNTPAWRRLVMCQEIAHDFGLDHQDETFDNANLGSCMDYTNDPDGGAGGAVNNDPSNEHPNAHDFEQIQTIYSHLDSTTTISGVISAMASAAARVPTAGELLADADQWGTPVRYDKAGRPNVFVRPMGVGHDGLLQMDVTHVFWAPIDPFELPEEGDNGRQIR